jgi:methionine-rich copper-binding protein CopC
MVRIQTHSVASLRKSSRLFLVFAITSLMLLFLNLPDIATPAVAHTHLVKSSPRAGAVIATSPADVTLTFDQPIQSVPGANGIVVAGPGNGNWACGPVQIRGNTVRATMSELGPPGEYLISYRVLGADGHPISGSVPVSLRRSASGHAESASAATTLFIEDRARGSAAIPMWLGIVLLTAMGVYAGVIVPRAVRASDVR